MFVQRKSAVSPTTKKTTWKGRLLTFYTNNKQEDLHAYTTNRYELWLVDTINQGSLAEAQMVKQSYHQDIPLSRSPSDLDLDLLHPPSPPPVMV